MSQQRYCERSAKPWKVVADVDIGLTAFCAHPHLSALPSPDIDFPPTIINALRLAAKSGISHIIKLKFLES